MYLKSLEIAGFKSFAKKANLDFTAPVTAVVGPNGSGKSNVAEAFRFALGEQSMKSMRGKRGEDLIWNGSPALARANRASVKIVFDNTKRLLNVDFDEVSIERIVHRDGINEYLINGSSVRLRDVNELLAGAHIGASGHHIISQGEADRILSAQARERREMIEDALGLKLYQYKRTESERRLEKTEENLEKVESLRRELAPHIRFLKKQVEKVERAVSLKQELSERYREYFRRERAYFDVEKKRIEEEGKAPRLELATIVLDIEKLKSDIASAQGSDEKSHALLSLEERLRVARDEVGILVREMGQVEGAISAEDRRLKRLQADIERSGAPVPFVQVAQFAGDIGQRADGIVNASTLDEAHAIGSVIKDASVKFVEERRNSVADAEKTDSQAELTRLAEAKTVLEGKVATARAHEASVRDEYGKLRESIEREKDTSREAERKLFTALSRQNEVSSTLSALSVRQNRLNLEEEDYKREIAEAVAIAGRDALLYETVEIKGADGSVLSDEAIAGFPREEQAERRRVIEKLKIRLEESGAAGGDEVMKEYKEASERDAFLAREIDDLQKSAESIRQLIEELTAKLATEFASGLTRINTEFQDLFALMFGGGTAELKIVQEKKRRTAPAEDADESVAESMLEALGAQATEDEEEPEVGLEVAVSLPHKRVRGLDMLSGGERALTSIALLFSISRVNPPPFVILDETDAALDEANSRKYGNMIEGLAKSSQLILITHNRETMSRAGVLYGITMGGDGCSRLLSIKFEDAVAVAK